MKKIAGLLLIFFSIISCKKDKSDAININYLNNTWIVVEQTVNDKPVEPFIKIMERVNIENNQILWIDTLDFGDSRYVFDTGFFNLCNLFSENFGKFSGGWNYDISQNKLEVYSSIIIDSTWNRDTVINGHSYAGSYFISNTYKINLLTESNLEMTSGKVHVKLNSE